MHGNFIFSSESVGEGHPDKVCDTISDAVLDACLCQDPASRVACETLVKSNLVVVAGEITTRAKFDYDKLIRSAIREIGYTNDDDVFHADRVHIMNALTGQSPISPKGSMPAVSREKKLLSRVQVIKVLCLGTPAGKPQNSCPPPSCSPTASGENSAEFANPAKPPGSGPMPKPKFPSNIATRNLSESLQSLSRPSTLQMYPTDKLKSSLQKSSFVESFPPQCSIATPNFSSTQQDVLL